MRVTKMVQDYIEKQVRAKIVQKYEAEKIEAQRIISLRSDIEQRAAKAAKQAALAILDEAKNHTDIFDYDEELVENIHLSGFNRVISLKDYDCENSVHKWNWRMRDEIDEKVQGIVVTLELGGSKADLDRMLSEL